MLGLFDELRRESEFVSLLWKLEYDVYFFFRCADLYPLEISFNFLRMDPLPFHSTIYL